MKFTDGHWLLRPGVDLRPIVGAHHIRAENKSLRLLGLTKPLRHRGDTLNAAALDVRLDSPHVGVIRVRVQHHAGGPAPLKFALTEDEAQPTVMVDEAGGSITSGPLTARVTEGAPWNLEFVADGRVVMHQRQRSLALATRADGTSHLVVQTSLGVGELVYGLGERFTAFVKNGQSVDIFNQDGGTASEQAYKNVPWFLTNRGYGVFVNHAGRVSMEVASEAVEHVQFSAATESLEYLVVYGPSPKEVLERYTALTGRAPVPPQWSFGLWLSTSFVTDYDEQTVTGFIDEIAARQIPLSVFHFDCFWMREFQWCDFTWDDRVFPDPPGMLARLKARGLRVCLWINPYIGQASPLFEEAAIEGYLLRRADGSVWQCDDWQAGLAIVDITNPEARQWFQSKLRPLLDMGVDCFKTDFGERIPLDVVYHDGSDPEQMHNLYSHLYNQMVWDTLSEHSPDDTVLFARAATAGSQTMPVHWGGDSTSSFESMAETLRGGLSLAMCGFGFWSHDIGGFEGHPDPAVFKRWLPFGLLSSHSRLHGNDSVRVPWAFDDEAVEVTRRFTRLKSELMPYLMGVAHEANQRGQPMLRPMHLEFPADRTCEQLDQQYMLGPSLLVAPVFCAEGDVEFYLPEGRWTAWWDGTVRVGPAWVREQHGFESLPLYVRPGSLIALGSPNDINLDPRAPAQILAFELDEGSVVDIVLPGPPGSPPARASATCRDGRTTVTGPA